jgi:hypothetical protein
LIAEGLSNNACILKSNIRMCNNCVGCNTAFGRYGTSIVVALPLAAANRLAAE